MRLKRKAAAWDGGFLAEKKIEAVIPAGKGTKGGGETPLVWGASLRGKAFGKR
jgi:hypothetical protein